jgi:DNA-binding LytR/AlgR family response regulator
MREKLSCYIIDDEHLARKILEEYVAKVSFLEWKGSFSGALEASGKMNTDRPDILFLDVNMPDLNGLNFIAMLNPKPIIILTTAYDQHALRAFDLEVRDYLLKPISFERFYKGVLRIYQEYNQNQIADKAEAVGVSQNETGYLFLKVGFRIQKVEIRDILYIEAMKDYLCIHTPKEKLMTLLSFAKLEDMLPDKKFARIHRSYMVALEKIEYIEKNSVRIRDKSFPVSTTYADSFFNKLNQAPSG